MQLSLVVFEYSMLTVTVKVCCPYDDSVVHCFDLMGTLVHLGTVSLNASKSLHLNTSLNLRSSATPGPYALAHPKRLAVFPEYAYRVP